MPRLEPLFFQPVLKAYAWGGRNLERLGRALPPGRTAESWEISDHPHGPTPVRAGEHAGRSLAELQRELGADLVGQRSAAALERGRFPLLVKLLDANEWLSVQVHPDDAYALRHHRGERGKTEMWVVLHAEPGAELVYGLRPGAGRREVARAAAEGELEPLLRRVPARAGDVFFVPAGTIHALGPGLLLAEIQQASDLTFRLFDWGRRDADRPLHLEQALAVADLHGSGGAVAPRRRPEGRIEVEELVRCPHFVAERWTFPPGASHAAHLGGDTFEIWGALTGRAELRTATGLWPLAAVDWALLPATLGAVTLSAAATTVLLRVRAP